jgi:hypothetical protein
MRDGTLKDDRSRKIRPKKQEDIAPLQEALIGAVLFQGKCCLTW